MTLLRRLRAGLSGAAARETHPEPISSPGSDATSMDGLRAAADATRLRIHAAEDVLPTWAIVMALGIVDRVRAALVGDLDSSLRIAAASLIRSHLPDTLQVAAGSLSHRHEGVDEGALFRQLTVLVAAADTLVDDVRAQDARRLAIQERFLAQRYDTPDLLRGMP